LQEFQGFEGNDHAAGKSIQFVHDDGIEGARLGVSEHRRELRSRPGVVAPGGLALVGVDHDEVEANRLRSYWPYHKPWIGYRNAREAYLNLKNNFNSIGRYSDASWAHRKERSMERRALGQTWRWGDEESWRSLWRGAWNWLACALTGYGESPWRPVFAGALVMLAFTGFFQWLGHLGYAARDGAAERTSACWWDSLLYSAAAFFTVGDSTVPRGR
jgi:hypothetical protein